jgi:hypothetical protein
MAVSEVDICNLALGMLGAEPIAALEDDNNCANQYPICRDACLEDVDWTFATSRFTLSSPSTTAPNFGFSNAFLIPSNVLRVIEVNGNEYPWQKEGDYIVTDEAVCEVRAIIRITNVRMYPGSFVQMLAARMASVLAIPITNSKGMVDASLTLYDRLKNEAKTNDGRQGSNAQFVRRDLRRRHRL